SSSAASAAVCACAGSTNAIAANAKPATAEARLFTGVVRILLLLPILEWADFDVGTPRNAVRAARRGASPVCFCDELALNCALSQAKYEEEVNAHCGRI